MRKEYTVTFKDFDNVVISISIVLYQEDAIAPKSPTRDGYTFYEWDKSFNNISSDLEIKAVYKPTTYVVGLDVNGGNETFNDLNFDFKSTINDLPTPTKDNFTFKGWYLDNEKFELPHIYNYTNDIVLTAKWTDAPEGLIYEVYNDEVTILSYEGINTHFTLPDTIEGLPVTSLAEGAFSNNPTIETIDLGSNLKVINRKSLSLENIKTIVIPTSVTFINKGALSGASSLISITIPFIGYNNSPTSSTGLGHIFGNEEYSGSYRVSANYIPLGLKEVTLTNETKVKDSSFFLVNTITSVIINEGVTSIGNNVFASAKSLTNISIPEGVITIGESAFANTFSLKSLVIPKSVESIGWSAFYFSGLEEITFIEGSNMTKIGDALFRSAINLKNITIPNNVTVIEKNAFNGAETITSIVIPEGVTMIGFNAFKDTTSLTDINLPNSITEIGESAFNGASSLVSLVIPDGITTIEANAFSEMSSLVSITIPNSVTKIEYSAFLKATSLTNITIPNSVTSIGNRAFERASALTSINIPYGITVIGDSTFLNASSLESVTLPSTITRIERLAFGNTTSLTNINIPNGLEFIGRAAFAEASSLTNIYIPISVTFVGEDAFRNCSLLTITIETRDQVNGWNSRWQYKIKKIIYIQE